MRRLLWLGVGAVVGAAVVRQVSRTVSAYSPSGLASSAANSAAGLWTAVQDFSGRAKEWVGDYVADVREGMAEREEQIHAAFARGEILADDLAFAGPTGDGDESEQDEDWQYPTR